ncbi:MAG: hypothetical protein ABW156_01710 [Jiangellaceae bacterium]
MGATPTCRGCWAIPADLDVSQQRPGTTPDEIAAGHCVALSRARELVDLLVGYPATQARP